MITAHLCNRRSRLVYAASASMAVLIHAALLGYLDLALAKLYDLPAESDGGSYMA